jgi:cbb3-type cytochrome oxidase cytochrome c subunit
MNYGPLIFLGAFFALAASWFSFVLTPNMQIGSMSETNAIPSGSAYPLARLGLAHQGLEVYRANGCVYCHSQQVGQTETVCDVILSEIGTNRPAVTAALLKTGLAVNEADAAAMLSKIPVKVLAGSTQKNLADIAVKDLNAAGAKAELWIVPWGPDIARGWGKRRTVAEDFLYDSPVLLGSQRVGPDLANVGSRLPDQQWHLRHLYAPRLEAKHSTMPPYRFLFQSRKIQRSPSPDALNNLPPDLAPTPGYEIVPRPEARALAAYLVSLRADAPLFDAPFTTPPGPPPADTNAPSAGALTNAPATNSPK